jgi:putative endonuclease
MYYLYILRCSDNSLYCGQTNNLERRINEHNFDKNKSAKYLRGKKPVKLVYSEKYSTLQEAMKREIEVKKLTKAKKEALIESDNYLSKRL